MLSVYRDYALELRFNQSLRLILTTHILSSELEQSQRNFTHDMVVALSTPFLPASCVSANPMLILSSLIKNMHEGSLAHHLEDNHLATDLECNFGALCEFTNSTLCTMLVVRMNLTQTGTQRVPEICVAVYDYLKFLTKEAEQSLTNPERNKWGFLLTDDPHTFTTYVRELQVVQEDTFVNQPVQSAAVTTTWLANMMHRVVPQDLYCGYLLIKEANFQVFLLTRKLCN
ncbi:uncharacterized protein DEA37_0011983 [Paragonimus westermani]|uniref:Uncharacterized protein n=1 Tax=Paragonimus westermani TaxID=34504 RepID=A0A5J4NZ21_9TREM|nr:uncharacterized protein DEA37_0011983 [Paragonimus westermani]